MMWEYADIPQHVLLIVGCVTKAEQGVTAVSLTDSGEQQLCVAAFMHEQPFPSRTG